MAQETCSSSSSSNQAWSYDVFVSFRGKDTRYKFTDHLFAALERSGIHSFEDNRKLKRGKDIWTELEKAIQKSRIAVIVFSENYVDSRWCLEELGKIMECRRNLQQIVLPVFYEVDPSHLRNQNRLEKAFVRHEKRFGVGKVDRWRAALTKAASLSGWDSQNLAHRCESKLIEEIIEDIVSKLNEMTHLTVASYPVGIESRVQELNKLLSSSSSEVCMVGIWGIGGIGKTTIAKAIYNQLQRNFDGSCFLANVGGDSKHPEGLIHLQEKILSNIHAKDNKKITLVDQGITILKDRAWCKRVLLVLDNVDHQDQLDKLAIRRSNFQPGSIIIITTRDKSILKLAKVDESKIYMPPTLDYHESIKLFSWHAFEKDHPNENYAELSEQVIGYAGGLPLVLTVLGSNLSYKSINEWKDTLDTLERTPDKEIQEKLMVSFNSLCDTQKELFLDLACFIVGMEKKYAFKILRDSYLGLERNLGVLVRQCLVAFDCSNRLTMHDMIRDMGREVARREHSRLWNHEDVLDVLEHDEERKLVKGIMLNCPGVHDLQVDAKAFSKMHQLRVLQLNYARLKGNFQCPSKKLRYLEWYGFPMESIPADLYLENLVALYMPYSSLIELWTGTKILKKLKFLDVSHSYHLRRTPDFSGIDNLEVLLLNDCTNLVEVHESVIDLSKLVTLDLKDCKNLWKLPPGIFNLESRVNLSGCTKLGMVPSFGFKSPLTCYSLRMSSEVPLGSVGFIRKLLTHRISSEVPMASFCFNRKLFLQKDFTKGGVQGKRRHLESAVTHHPFLSQPLELIGPNLEYCENLYQLSGEICRVAELLFGRKISKMRLIIPRDLQFLHDMEFLLPAGIDISKGLPPPVNDNVKVYLSLPNPLEFMIVASSWAGEVFYRGIFSMREKDGRYLRTRKDFKILSNFIIFFGANEVREKLDHSSSLASKIYPSRLQVTFNFLNQLTSLDLSLCRRFQSLDELPTGLQAMDASNTTSLVWIFTGLNVNWELSKQLQCFGCSKVLKKNRTSNPKNKLLNELIATDSFSVFRPGGEFPNWFDALVVSKGSILSFVVPSLVKQEIRGWFLCAIFASSFHDIHGFTVSYKFKNRTKGIEWQCQQKKSRVIPCQEHMWLQFVPLHHMPHLFEAGDEVEYSIRISGGFQVKKFGVKLIYENDKKDCHSYFEAVVKNASLPYKDDFLDEDVSTDQPMAGDKKINPSNLQKSRFDGKKKGIATSLDASKRGCLSARETTQQQWDKDCELSATILEDPTVAPEDHSALVEAEIIEDKKMQQQQLGRVRVMVGALLRPAQTLTQIRGPVSHHEHEQLRFMAIKPPTRAAVHGTRLPVADTLNREELEAEINKRKEEKENKRKEVEKTVDSQLKLSDHDSSNKSPVD
ncbi:disease resistance protein RML1A-like isoform X2 [Castanea sativa]|uniref:disease resistance protein RML1A-like isoform X2 n=1 Tax=Castanea sativa TaxID=21020 RepID=UPI003F653AAD